MQRLAKVLSQIAPVTQTRSVSSLRTSFDATPLAQPFISKNLKLKNRIVMAPMTRSKSPLHIPGTDVVKYYRRRAEGNTGLIITEGTVIHPTGHGYPDVPNFFGEKSLAGWKQVVDEVHEAGGKIVPQLWHVGSVRQPAITDSKIPSLGPSAVNHPGFPKGVVPQEMTQENINEIIESFVSAAKSAQQLGFDGIELHGAHGYLFDQFFWSATNQRTDKYGGKTIGERTAFAVEVITKIRKVVGPNFPIILRFSQWKIGDFKHKLANNPEELKSFLLPLSNAGVDIFHCSTRRFHEPEFPDISKDNLAVWTKKITGKPVITVGSVGLDSEFIGYRDATKPLPGLQNSDQNSLSQTAYLIENVEKGHYDLVAVGRALLGDAAWAKKVFNHEINQIDPFTNEKFKNLI